MAARGSRRQIASSPEPSDGDELESPGEHPDTSSTSVSQDSAAKRRKLNDSNGYVSSPSPGPASARFVERRSLATRQRSSLANEPSDESEEDEEEALGEGGFQPGAIKRVRLTNFVTYSSAEFSLGPSLNMVIGPNGTGKSTLVCAICIGLGFEPTLMGRQKKATEFVKHGATDATIEIELQGRRTDETELTVTCKISRGDADKTEFRLNGRKSNKKSVLEEARRLHIQIDNLCQFLPQDRVADFAGLTPIQLLTATQNAAGRDEMKGWQEKLQNWGKEKIKKEQNQTIEIEQLKNTQRRQEVTQEEVDRYREREEIIKTIDFLERTRPFPAYREARIAAQDAKKRAQEAKEALKRIEEDTEPLQRLQDKNAYREAILKAQQHRERAYEQAKKGLDDQSKSIDTLKEKIEGCDTQRTSTRKLMAKCRDEARIAQGRIANLKQQMESQPPPFDNNAWSELRREREAKRAQMSDDITALQNKQRELVHIGRDATEKKKQGIQSLQRMQGAQGKQLVKLQNISPDTAKAWEWVQENQHRFEKPVFGPPAVECAVNDRRYVNAIETLFQKGDLLAITVQTRGDLNLLNRVLSDEERLFDVHIRTNLTGAGPETSRAPMSDEQRQALGFDGWALDYLTGPAPVLGMLCTDLRLHQTAVSLQDINDEQYRRIEESPVTNWVTGRTSYQITRRREYGPGATSTRTRPVKNAYVWTEGPVDNSAMQALQRDIQEWTEQIASITQKNEDYQKEIQELRTQVRKLEEEGQKAKDEKEARLKQIRSFATFPDRLAAEESKQTDAEARLVSHRKAFDELRNKEVELTFRKARVTAEFAEATQRMTSLFEDVLEAHLYAAEAESDVTHLETESASLRAEVDRLKAEAQEQTAISQPLMDKARKLSRTCQKALDGEGGDELKEFINSELEEDISGAQLEGKIEGEKSRLALHGGADSGALREFEARKKEIEVLTDSIDSRKREIRKLEKLIADVRSKWEPELDRLIGLISAAFGRSFEKIGCAGEVEVDKSAGENFDAWAVRILVKFRESESLQQLTDQRQSGGERAVSTVFYLMAMQSLSKAPFRVVDEINQGMDPRNERMVHERLVGIACGENVDGEQERGRRGRGSQYFLVTPKLLTGLHYHPKMRVHIIASGEHMPRDYMKLSLGRTIERQRALMAAVEA